jgi:hypothetical protein
MAWDREVIVRRLISGYSKKYGKKSDKRTLSLARASLQ